MAGRETKVRWRHHRAAPQFPNHAGPVQIDIDAAAMKLDHTIAVEKRFQLAMARQ